MQWWWWYDIIGYILVVLQYFDKGHLCIAWVGGGGDGRKLNSISLETEALKWDDFTD